MTPDVSVLVPSYQHADYLPKLVESVLGQTFGNFEVIVVDDGSRDGSLGLLQEVRDPRFKVTTHEGHANRGLVPTLKLAVELSSAPLLAVVASDDLWLPDRLSRTVSALGESDAVYCQAHLIYPSGDRVGVVIGEAAREGDLFDQLLVRNVVPAPAVLMRRSAYEAAGGYSEDSPYEDLHLMIALAARGDVAFLPAPLVEYRISESGLFSSLERQHGALTAVANTVRRASSPWEDDPKRGPTVREVRAAWDWLARWESGGRLPADRRGTSALPTLVEAWRDQLRTHAPLDHARLVRGVAGVNIASAARLSRTFTALLQERSAQRMRALNPLGRSR